MGVKTALVTAILLGASAVKGETRIDLRSQGKNIDFSTALSVRPFQTGTTLPATCSIGEMFFKTDAPAGSNSYGCVAMDVWAVQGGGTGSPSSPLAMPLAVTRPSNSMLTVGADCSVAQPCRVRIGSVVHTFSGPATATALSGTGTFYIYVSRNGSIVFGTQPETTASVTCSGCITALNGASFPLDSVPLARWNALGGIWEQDGADMRAVMSASPAIVPGPHVTIAQSDSTVTISGSPDDLMDLTSFRARHVFAESAYEAAGHPWRFNGSCGQTGATAGVAGEMAGPKFSATGAGTFCWVRYGQDGYTFADFLSGASPKKATYKARYARTANAGDQYIGWASGSTDHSNFAGLRYTASAGQWQCVIRAGGSDVAAANVAAADLDAHTFSIVTDGTPNSLSCSVDAVTQSVTGTIPPSGWVAIAGVQSSGAVTSFVPYEVRILIEGLSR